MEELKKKFLSQRDQYRLGELLTERPHPKTIELSSLAQNDLEAGYRLFKQIDLETLSIIENSVAQLDELKKEIHQTLKKHRKVYICGCGATGRLALTLERIWREAYANDATFSQESIVAFMAGGDLALVKSIESFEDREDFGARQLEELGFSDNDLLICVTEGGETPFVIGACEKSLELSDRSPYFLYANPDEVLKKVALRSKRVLENQKIKKINLMHSPQVLAGSTRLQASSVLMAALGLALSQLENKSVRDDFYSLMQQIRSLETARFAPFTLKEHEDILSQYSVYYSSEAEYLISLFTDTTERSPTFSLTPFEHDEQRENLESCSWCYLVSSFSDPKRSWQKILGRSPRSLEWPEVRGQAGAGRLQGHDFSKNVIAKRSPFFKGSSFFNLKVEEDHLHFQYAELSCSFKVEKSRNLFFEKLLNHLCIKILLNAHSTLLMGRLERYQGNLMTYVKPSNFKLIDRACRYSKIILERNGYQTIDDVMLIDLCFSQMQKSGPVVLNIVEAYKKAID